MFFRRSISTGEYGERLARKFLQRQGWRIVETNLRVGHDEIDIIAVSVKEKVLSLVEVRSTCDRVKDPRETIGKAKRTCLMRSARRFEPLAAKNGCTLRLDLVTVNLGQKRPRVRLFENFLLV
ncbi:MAG: YraN family protein [Phycisphaerales bacterium]|jgi:putative endonuclease|nr:YraN family protein [Phycisphaerales bacterium]